MANLTFVQYMVRNLRSLLLIFEKLTLSPMTCRRIPSDAVLTLFFRRPTLGVGKQRLAADIGQDNALRMAKLLLDCALEDMADWPGVLVFAIADKADRPWAQQLVADRFADRECHLIDQPEGNLGDRINGVDQRLRAMDYSHIYYMGSDAPLLHSDIFRKTSQKLLKNDVALASSEDGGVTLMASKQPWPALQTLPWSTDQLRQSLAQACSTAGQSVATLIGLYDIDTVAELDRALFDLITDPRQARRAFCYGADQILQMQDTDAA